ncbi:nitrate reductase cytochrome c-type subunit [Coralliovum pocilloporae]|uniref:nitrate reductase cytochrome c-type subunit n=1 Tax=Coralliovum pocilloporae TaxID=3066369 RepID=UPI0033075C58
MTYLRSLIRTAGLAALVLTTTFGIGVYAEDNIATLRGKDLAPSIDAPAIPKVVNSDLRQVRNYPEQPPLIPHKTDNYQVDKNVNKCMTCHSRTAVGESQAPMVSITHFMDRDGQFRASISPRRYFCNQCHVTQSEARPLVENEFVDVDSVLRQSQDQ